MSDQMMPQPAPEHAQLLEAVGTWDVKGKFYMAPSAPPMQSTGVDTIEAVGGFWVVGRYESEFFGMPFHGRGTVGYDPFKKEYVSIWVDSMSAVPICLTGQREGNVITMTGPGVDPGTGNPMRYKTVETVEPNRREFSMFIVQEDGTDHRLMDMDYTRRT